jgi:PIN domain nuclease of toxin-antitoxin system
MNLLLDTHIFIWIAEAPNRLPAHWKTVLADRRNTLWLSAVSVWEMQIKTQLGRLTLQLPLPDLLAAQQSSNGIRILPIQLPHIFELSQLPQHHTDPFDRLLIAQAKHEAYTLVSVDSAMPNYLVTLLP